MAAVTVTIAGIERLNKVLATGITVRDWRPVYPEVAGWFYRLERERFASEGGGFWPQLAPSTVKKRGSAHPILDVTGALRRSLTEHGAPGSVYEAQTDSLELGSALKVGKWNLAGLHQSGTKRMPARPPVFVSWHEMAPLRRILQQFIHDQVGRAIRSTAA